jgi:hypothetical protein
VPDIVDPGAARIIVSMEHGIAFLPATPDFAGLCLVIWREKGAGD